MAWLGRSLGDSVSSLTGQLSNLTKDLLTEGTEEVSDHATELSLAKEHIANLESIQTTQRAENERLKRVVRELDEKAESSELQINSISRQYRAQLEEKEKEINSLKQRHHELLEHQAKDAALLAQQDVTDATSASAYQESQGFHDGLEDWSSESWGDFDDSLRLQREINHLRQEVARLRSDGQHWRSVAGQLSQQEGSEVNQSAHHELLSLQAKVKKLERQAAESREQAQQEVVSLQDVHHNKVATLKKRHKEEVTQLKSQLSSLEQQLGDARDGDSTGTGGSSSGLPESERAESEVEKTLRSQLASLKEEKDRLEAVKLHLQGELEELQQEVETLHTWRDQHQAQVSQLEERLHSQQQQHQTQLDLLRSQLQEAEAWRAAAEQSHQQVGLDLVQAKHCLLEQLEASHENQLKTSIVQTGTQLQQVSSDTETLIEQLGEEQSREQAAAMLDSLERERLVLQEQNVKLQEQVALLEKRSVTQQQDWHRSQATISQLQQELQQLQDGTGSDGDNTLDQSFASDAHSKSNSHVSQSGEEGSPMDWQLQKEALEEVLVQLRQEVREKDNQISQLSSRGEEDSAAELSSLKEEKERLLEELSSVREEKEELETSIGELDEQHEEATNHLIAARNTLQSRLADSQQQVKSLQEELKALQQQQQIGAEPSSAAATASEQMELLRKELENSRQELSTLQQQAETREAEMSELKVKLQKGTMAINDLHMDKKDLEEALASKQEEVKVKVAAIKTLREDKARLAEENKDLAERLQELEEEVETWEQRNEEMQVGKSEVEQLQAELSVLKEEKSSQQQKLDSMFTELDRSRALCRKLQQEQEARDQDGDAQQSLLAERDAAVQEKNKAMERILQLEKDMAALSGAKEEQAHLQLESASSSSQRGQELETKLTELQRKVERLSEENSALQTEVAGLKEEAVQVDSVDGADLRRHHRHLVKALEKRRAALSKLKEDFDKQTKSEKDTDSQGHTSQGELLTRESVLELCTESRTLMEALVSGSSVVEDIEQHFNTGSVESVPVLTQTRASTSQAPPRLEPNSNSNNLDVAAVQAENQRLWDELREKESEVYDLQECLTNLKEEHITSKQASDSLSERLSGLETVISEKDSELEILHTENAQLMTICEESKSRLTQSELKMESLKSQLHEMESVLHQAQEELNITRDSLERITKDNASHSHLTKELDSARNQIRQLESELSDASQSLSSHKEGIEELNSKYSEQKRCLERQEAQRAEQEDAIAILRNNCESAEKELVTVRSQLGQAMKLLSEEQRSTVMGRAKDPPASPQESLLAIEYAHKPALPAVMDYKVEDSNLQNGEVEVTDGVEQSQSLKKHAELLQQLQEKEDIIADLQQNNNTLVQMLEARSQSGDSSQLEVHRLQSEVKALKVEKEQMLAVMNEKSREASSLKAEVMRLMSVVSAEKSALDKLQKDNQELMSRSSPPRDDTLEDMTREAMQNLSRLVRDREVEIEALKQKNETLMAVLQDMNQGDQAVRGAAHPGTTLAAQLAHKENLEKQLAALQAEREQMVAFVNQKHAESVTYHAEIQRLTALRAEENQRMEQLQSDYSTLCPQFEDKKQSLLKVQNDLINYRQKYAELEVKYGELLQKSNASETVDAASFHEVEEEKERLASKHSVLQQDIKAQEEKLLASAEKLKEMEAAMLSKDSELSAMKKQVDSLHFQVQGLRNEMADLQQERQAAEQRQREWQEQGKSLKDLNNQLTLAMREKEFEVSSLQERVQKVTALVSEQQGEKTQVAQLLKDQEEASGVRAGLQQEVDQLTLALKQKQQHINDLQAENVRLKEKEQKLSRELDRLRSHLLQIEEGYTREALEAEEREKTLRNRLAHAEEQLSTTASQVQSASQQASQQVESLQQQLHSIASQRDAAYMQVANLQEQCEQYASSLSNLQLVLEQFQREKESQIAAETERYQQESRRLQTETKALQKQLQETKVELEEAADGLAAASRLSEQLDRKEEALQALREEVQHRETALRTAEEEIHKLNSSTEAKVDRELMKNLLLGYFHTPDRNRMDAIHAIGSVLGFTHHDFQRIEESQGGGWVSTLFRRTHTPSVTPPSTPVRQPGAANQSFSQLFVKFLEVESTPPPAPVRMPAEEMAREAQQRHHVKERDSRDKPAFNPFTAPRHVSMPIAVGSAATAAASSGSHILMAPPPGSPTTAFPVFAPFSSTEVSSQQNSILKDVLGSR